MNRFRLRKLAWVTLVAVAPLLVSSVSAQTPSWVVFWGGPGFDIAGGIASDVLAVSLDNGGNVYLAGTKQPGPFGGYDAFVASYDPVGILRWQSFWGSSGGYDSASAIALDILGNVYITGVTSPGSFGAYDVFVVSFDSSGDFRWEAFWGTSSYDWASAVAVDTLGNIFVSGRTSQVYYPGPWNAFLVSFNSSGGFRWEAFWGTPSGYDRADAVSTDSFGNVYIGGRTGQGEVFGQPYEAFVASYDSFGNLRWETLWGKVACDFIYGVAVDLFGNVYVAGVTYIFGPNGGDDAFLVAFNSSGGFRWEAFWGTPNREVANGVTVDLFGNVYIAGYASQGPFGGDDAFIASFNSSGDFMWDAIWGTEGTDHAVGVCLDLLGKVYIGGYSYPGTLGGYDSFIAAFTLPPIDATVSIDPRTLNLASNGKLITCRIELPEDYDVNDINIQMTRLDDDISIDPSAPFEIGDHDGNGIPDLTVKFDRSILLARLHTADYTDDAGKSYEDIIKVLGIVKGMPFEGFATVKILNK